MATRSRPSFYAVTAVALVAGGLTACSSAPPSEPLAPGAVAAGTAEVSIEGRDASSVGSVSCQTVGTVTTVESGDQDAGLTVVVSSDPSLLVDSVSIRNLAGFTGSYLDGLGDEAQVDLSGRTYEISGTADGFATDDPSFRTAGTFSIKLAC